MDILKLNIKAYGPEDDGEGAGDDSQVYVFF